MMKRTLKARTQQTISLYSNASCQNFTKKGYRVLSKLQINRTQTNYEYSHFAQLFKAIKTIKYTRNLDLIKLKLHSRSLYLPKIVSFAKRMSRVNSIKIFNFKNPKYCWKGIFESCAKYAKRAEIFKYHFIYENPTYEQNISPKASTNSSQFLHLLRYQPFLKDLTVKYVCGSKTLSEKYWRFENYPATLERLSLKNPLFQNHPTTSFNHLKNLKHLGITFSKHIFQNSLVSVLPCLSTISSNLQSLSLDFNKLSQALNKPSLAALKTSSHHLKRLRLQIFHVPNLADFLKAFAESPISHLNLLICIRSQSQFLQISDLIKRLSLLLQSLKLRITWREISPEANQIKELLSRIQNLCLLTSLSVSLTSDSPIQKSIPEFTPIIIRIFNKPIPFTSFKIKSQLLNLSKQGFLNLIQALQPHIETLTKLRIDTGQFQLEKTDQKKLLDFLKSLKNIRCLELDSLNISAKAFLAEYINAIYGMPFLRTLSCGQIYDNSKEEVFFMKNIQRILEKRGLRKFNCQVAESFRDLLNKLSSKISLSRVREKNPCLKKTPCLYCFEEKLSLTNDW